LSLALALRTSPAAARRGGAPADRDAPPRQPAGNNTRPDRAAAGRFPAINDEVHPWWLSARSA
jgi:hypothetical protein